MLDYEEEYKLAIRLSYGIGMEKDEVAALKHFKHSAYQGYYPAMMSLAFRDRSIRSRKTTRCSGFKDYRVLSR